jgi:predicted nucleotidyltransferase
MNDFLLDISKKIEPQKAVVLAAVNRVACKNGIPFFIAGGAARDFILQSGYGVRTRRVTLDVDIGIKVSSWDEYSKIIEALLNDEGFARTGVEHRYESPLPQKIKVDILPFGEIETQKRMIRWRQGDNEMNMTGFNEAYEAAIAVRILSSPPVSVKMTSLAGLAFLKLISWNEQPHTRDRDAKDFKEIMYNYLETYPNGSIYSIHPDIAEEDYDFIAARALGRDIGIIGAPEIQAMLVKIVSRECDPAGPLNFILQMRINSIDGDFDSSRDLKMLQMVNNGIMDMQYPEDSH